MIKVDDLDKELLSVIANDGYSASIYASLLRVVISSDYDLSDDQILKIARALKSADLNQSKNKIINLLNELSPYSE